MPSSEVGHERTAGVSSFWPSHGPQASLIYWVGSEVLLSPHFRTWRSPKMSELRRFCPVSAAAALNAASGAGGQDGVSIQPKPSRSCLQQEHHKTEGCLLPAGRGGWQRPRTSHSQHPCRKGLAQAEVPADKRHRPSRQAETKGSQ